MTYSISEKKELVKNTESINKISEYPLIEEILSEDLLLVERDGEYYSLKANSLGRPGKYHKYGEASYDAVKTNEEKFIAILALSSINPKYKLIGDTLAYLIDEENQIYVDALHDLSYYIYGNEYYSSAAEDSKLFYEWGGLDVNTGIQDAAVGAGMLNTLQLIIMATEGQITPSEEGYPLIWEKIIERANMDSSGFWFVPSLNEAKLIYENRSNLYNLEGVYWTSTECEPNTGGDPFINYNYAYAFNSSADAWNTGGINLPYKKDHSVKTRLCCQIS